MRNTGIIFLAAFLLGFACKNRKPETAASGSPGFAQDISKETVTADTAFEKDKIHFNCSRSWEKLNYASNAALNEKASRIILSLIPDIEEQIAAGQFSRMGIPDMPPGSLPPGAPKPPNWDSIMAAMPRPPAGAPGNPGAPPQGMPPGGQPGTAPQGMPPGNQPGTPGAQPPMPSGMKPPPMPGDVTSNFVLTTEPVQNLLFISTMELDMRRQIKSTCRAWDLLADSALVWDAFFTPELWPIVQSRLLNPALPSSALNGYFALKYDASASSLELVLPVWVNQTVLKPGSQNQFLILKTEYIREPYRATIEGWMEWKKAGN